MLFHFCFQGELLYFYAVCAFIFLCSLDFPEKNESPLTIMASGLFVLSKGMRGYWTSFINCYIVLNPQKCGFMFFVVIVSCYILLWELSQSCPESYKRAVYFVSIDFQRYGKSKCFNEIYGLYFFTNLISGFKTS